MPKAQVPPGAMPAPTRANTLGSRPKPLIDGAQDRQLDDTNPNDPCDSVASLTARHNNSVAQLSAQGCVQIDRANIPFVRGQRPTWLVRGNVQRAMSQ
jgi:hypothetical protein